MKSGICPNIRHLLGESKSSSQRRMDAFLMSFEERRGEPELIWIKWTAIRKRQQRQRVLGKMRYVGIYFLATEILARRKTDRTV